MSDIVRGSTPPPAAPCKAELHGKPVEGTTPSVYRMHVALASVYIETDQELPEGAIVNVQISLPRQKQELKTVARVSYRLDPHRAAALQRKAGVGLVLLDVWGREASDTVETALGESQQPGARRTDNERDVLIGAKVLIVDDDASYREYAGQGMLAAGCQVLTAHNGVEGLSVALREVPDLIISDVTMPGLDGWQLLRLLRTKKALRRTPVIFLTELKDEADRLRGYRLGVDDYLAKPFGAEELTVRARRAIERVASAAQSSGLQGEFADLPLGTVLSLIELERKHGRLELNREGERATLHLHEGQVCRIDLDPAHAALEGIDRFFHVLDWKEGRFELKAGDGPPDPTVEHALKLRSSFVLLQHAARHDGVDGAAEQSDEADITHGAPQT